MKKHWLLMAGWLCGCGPAVGGGPLRWPVRAEAALFEILPEGASEPTWAWLRGESLVAAEAELPQGGMATVWGFEPSLEALQVETGPLRRASPTAGSCEDQAPRPLPELVAAFEGGPEGWSFVEAQSRADEVLLPALDLENCLQPTGCVDSSRRFCRLNCPPFPEVAEPISPMPPAPVEICPECESGRPEPGTCGMEERFDVRTGLCRPVGADCLGVDPFPPPDDLEGITLFVDPQAPAGGDGRRNRPWSEVIPSQVPEGSRVLLAQGRHEVGALVANDLWLEGACSQGTLVEGELRLGGTSTVAHLQLNGALVGVASSDVTARDLVVEGREGQNDIRVRGRMSLERSVVRGEIRSFAEADLRLVEVDVQGQPAIFVQGTRSRLRDVVARGVSTFAAIRSTGVGEFDATRLVATVERRANALSLESTGPAALSDVVLLGTEGRDGFRLVGGEVHIERAYVSGFQGRMLNRQEGGGVVATDLYFAQMGNGGSGIEISAASATIQRMRLEGANIGLGVSANTRIGQLGVEPRPVVLEDLHIEGVARGIRLEEVNGRISRARLRDMETTGIDLSGPTNLEIEDVEVEGAGTFGVLVGASVDEALQGVFRRVLIRRAEQAGIHIEQEGMRFEDVDVRGGVTGVEIIPGVSLNVESLTEFDRIRLEDNTIGLFLERLVPAVAERFRFGQVAVLQATTGVQVGSCFPQQGELFDEIRFEGVQDPILFTSTN